MVKLSYEDGHLVIRNMNGILVWNSHWVDMKGSYVGEPSEGGYKEIILTGELIEKHDYYPEDKVVFL
jgi:hypothetical protein